MREIKFRGFQKSWIYGGISVFENEATIFDVNCVVNSAYQVDIKSVGQFTGSIDNKGVEIYEGDIVRMPKGFHPKNREIVFTEYGSWYMGHCGIGFGNLKANGFVDCEVIGNIYENPELLAIPTAVL